MSDVIERLLEIEREARRIIEQAERDAARILDEAREEARRIRTESRQAAQREADELLASNARALRQQRDRAIQAEQARLPSPKSMDQARLDQAVQFAVNVVAYSQDGGA